MGKLLENKFKTSPKPKKYKYADLFPTNVAVDSPTQHHLKPKSLWRRDSPQKPTVVLELPPISPGGTVQSYSGHKNRRWPGICARVLLVVCLGCVAVLNASVNSVTNSPAQLLQAATGGVSPTIPASPLASRDEPSRLLEEGSLIEEHLDERSLVGENISMGAKNHSLLKP